jgi:hypothetical protein
MDGGEAVSMEPVHVGEVVATHASLLSVVGDARAVARYRGVERDDGEVDPESAETDWARSLEAMTADDGLARLDIEGGAVSVLGVGAGGTLDVFQVGEQLVLLEGSFADDVVAREHAGALAFVAAPPSASAREIGHLAVESGILALVPNTATARALGAHLEAKAPVRVQFEAELGLVVPGVRSRYRVLLESEAKHDFGYASRCILVPEA